MPAAPALGQGASADLPERSWDDLATLPLPAMPADSAAAEEPEAVAVSRETIELAFIVAVQQLPPQGRAALLLRDVLGWSAADSATLRAAQGRIVNIGSIQSFVHVRTPSSPAYTAAKHGVLGFTRALAAELGKDGVRVNAIGPGFIETPLNAAARANNPELAKTFVAHTPLGRAGAGAVGRGWRRLRCGRQKL